ncbi:MAG: type II toxin-antitoxin system RelE/ParE family toxin [Neorhizobium sp.]|nr:type II toxin-antitoxin system RelE/ParE family toxin [Neorhizobium sp.]
MYIIEQTQTFRDWLSSLRDKQAAARITSRIERAQAGNLGDVKPVGEGVSEMRIAHGPGYRVYVVRKGQRLLVLLCGGDKSTQEGDIAQAKRLAHDWRKG